MVNAIITGLAVSTTIFIIGISLVDSNKWWNRLRRGSSVKRNDFNLTPYFKSALDITEKVESLGAPLISTSGSKYLYLEKTYSDFPYLGIYLNDQVISSSIIYRAGTVEETYLNSAKEVFDDAEYFINIARGKEEIANFAKSNRVIIGERTEWKED